MTILKISLATLIIIICDVWLSHSIINAIINLCFGIVIAGAIWLILYAIDQHQIKQNQKSKQPPHKK